MDSPDNLTVTPRGGLLAVRGRRCRRDDRHRPAGARDQERQPPHRPHAAGEAFEFAVNVLSATELAGVCFSPDGETLFVNLFGASDGTPAEHADEGMTCAITGPWRRGPL